MGRGAGRAFAVKVEGNDFPFPRFPDFYKVIKVIKRIVSKMEVQIKSGKRENGKSFWCNLLPQTLYRLWDTPVLISCRNIYNS